MAAGEGVMNKRMKGKTKKKPSKSTSAKGRDKGLRDGKVQTDMRSGKSWKRRRATNKEKDSDEEDGSDFESEGEVGGSELVTTPRKSGREKKKRSHGDCLEDEDLEQAHDEIEVDGKYCRECNREEDDSDMLLCDGCSEGHHIFCLTPTLAEIPDGEWFCDKCKGMTNE